MADETQTVSLTTSSNPDNINGNIQNDDNVTTQRIENVPMQRNELLPEIKEETSTELQNKSDEMNNNNNNNNEQNTLPQIDQMDQNQNILTQKKLKRKKKVTMNPTNNKQKLPTSETSTLITNTRTVDENLNKKRKTKINNQIAACDNNESKIIMEGTNSKELDNKIPSFLTNEIVLTKPPLPPSKIPIKPPMLSESPPPTMKIPPPRLKRKLDDHNSMLVQKLNACTEQLRLEINDLKTALGSERNAVRMLRAQYEAETRKSKMEIKKLQAALEMSKKAVIAAAPSNKKFKEDSHMIKDPGGDHTKLAHEINALREANRILEEKIQILSEAERRKTADIRELKDSYEIRLTQISKSAKTEISRLLEEIKTKERNIGQLKKEINLLKNPASTTTATIKKDMKRSAQHSPEMKKLKDIERINSSNTTNQKCITTTCGGDNDFHETPHEINERILESHTDLHIYRNKDAINSSDTDSALSSAPQSISPQPPANGIVDSSDIWQSVKNYSKEIDTLQKNNELLQKENETLKNELDTVKQQILQIEKTVQEANKMKIQQLTDRIRYLEDKEDTLLKESHELREQNELLEFRILELEESHEKNSNSESTEELGNSKWSLRSSSNPDTRDMWTDTDRKSDDILMYTSDHTDSGVTSPHSHHHIDDRNVISPCDLSLMDHTSNDEIKRRLADITKRPYINDEDKICLLQVLTLINNLESLSEDSILVNDEMISLDLTKSKASDYGSDSSSPRSLSTTDIHQPLQRNPKLNNNNISNNSRIVATVLPYSSTLSTPTDSPRKLRNWNSISLQESGVFEGDTLDCTQSTQTEPEDFITCVGNSGTTPTADLCAEIQKLNKFREKIEECVTKSASSKVHSTTVTQTTPTTVPATLLSPNLSDQRRLQYYKDRLELLENKLLIYESSGDLQTKRLAERLQREIKLESLVKELQQKVQSLESDNLRLEEEKCEFEEAENDTRLRLQRLEIDLEILNQRNTELEMSKEAVQNKLKEARNQCTQLQENMKEEQQKVEQLEEDSKDLKNRLNLIKTSMPAILLFNTLMVSSSNNKLYKNNNNNIDNNKIYHDIDDDNENENSTALIAAKKCLCNTEYPVKDYYLENKVQELLTREKELTQSISELNRAYHETLENADNLWVQIEKEYKDRLSVAESTENQLKVKITQLEESLAYNSQCAQERIQQLEDIEQDLQHRITRLIKEKKDIVFEHENLLKECQALKDELTNLKNFIATTVQDNLDKERQRVRGLEEDLAISNNLLSDMENTYRNELQSLKSQLYQASKELLHIEVTNSELKEEVTTLEKEIIELQKQRCIDEEKIRNLTDELRTKEELLIQMKMKSSNMKSNRLEMIGQSLAQELEPNKSSAICMTCSNSSCENNNGEVIEEIDTVQMKLKEALDKAEKKSNYSPQCESIMKMAKEVQDLANTLYLKKINKKFILKNEIVQTENLLPFKDQSISPINYSIIDSSDEFQTVQNSSTTSIESNITQRKKIHIPASDSNITNNALENYKCQEKFTKSNTNSLNNELLEIQYHQQERSFTRNDDKKSNYYQIDNENMNESKYLEILQNNNKYSIDGISSIFKQFRKTISHVKSKIFHERNNNNNIHHKSNNNKYPDFVCNKCLGELLSNDMKCENPKCNAIYHLNPEYMPNTEGSIPITVCGKKFTPSVNNQNINEDKKINNSFMNNMNVDSEITGKQKKNNENKVSDVDDTVATSCTISTNLKNSHSNYQREEEEDNMKDSITYIKRMISTPSSYTDEIIHQYSKGCSTQFQKFDHHNEPINLKKDKKSLKKIKNDITNVDIIIALIREDLQLGNNCLNEMEDHLRELYENNTTFKRDLDLTVNLGCPQWCVDSKRRQVRSCQDIVCIMACLKKIRILYSPHQIMIFKKIEEEVTDKLIAFYCNSRSPKLYCQVYSPVQHKNKICYVK